PGPPTVPCQPGSCRVDQHDRSGHYADHNPSPTQVRGICPLLVTGVTNPPCFQECDVSRIVEVIGRLVVALTPEPAVARARRTGEAGNQGVLAGPSKKAAHHPSARPRP